MTEQVTSRGRLSLTTQELEYLQRFLDAHDRAGFYAAYYAMTSSEPGSPLENPFGDAEFGKREASLQAKISSFSENVGAAAFLANRVLQEQHRNNGYDGIYFLSQQVAQAAMDAMLADKALNEDGVANPDGDGLLSDHQFFESAVDAWRRNQELR